MKSNITIRMTAANWDATVRKPDGEFVSYDFRKMPQQEFFAFNRELVKAFRVSRI